MRRTTMSLLRYYPMADTIKETTNVLQIGIESFLSHIDETLHPVLKEKLEEKINKYQEQGLPQDLSKRLGLLQTASTSPDIILIANETQCTVPDVAEVYFKIGLSFFFGPLRDVVEGTIATTTLWDRRLVASLLEDLYNYQSDLTISILLYAQENNIPTDDHFETLLEHWNKAHQNQIRNIELAMKEGQVETKPDLAAISVIVRELRHLSGN